MFGSLQVFCNGRSFGRRLAPHSKTLLALLALRYGRSVRREEIVDLLWSADYDKMHRRRLSTILWRVNSASPRNAQGCEIVHIEENGDIRIDADASTYIDLAEFEAIFKAIPAHVEKFRDSDGAAIEKAVNLYRGDLLEDMDSEWLCQARAHVRQCNLDMLQLLILYLDKAGKPDKVTTYANRFLQIDPYDESVHLALAKAYLTTGKTGLAATQLDLCRRVLRDDLGVPLSADAECMLASLRTGRRRTGPRTQPIAVCAAPDIEADRVRKLRTTVSRLLVACAELLEELPPDAPSDHRPPSTAV
ncbi:MULTISPECIES: AfsR/SARP family transcriptional regulator [Bradyrhizobium]|uniref:DNA-binding SARP family transcriptional activator n=1 Tax=Bradyrhizobium elkanii TaxID=29448 RepID=A0A8I2C090_BRAEL|nr:BTAD domain-containing putative transcriptional regulator [Bradyrhizobium elkanii]MBP1293555.1 DNA-binding SARP family transcriptional activator [Bradyrhizobium elkanii]MCS3476648.1 DNA-binding SARP family transcriptional activator [Bradyrhizobium elkanii]MCS3716954.1 DNA-binding SARP family transcriptional activator [Bradyrhizobium elkanii]MCS4010672.1 DNA-binding SARP family transcriptional activator [Bradyrhizobium elkanii USDA 61]MCW2206802.1 DNA-binding SARP family transcriptional acti